MKRSLEELLRKKYESMGTKKPLRSKRIKSLEIVRKKTLYGYYAEDFLYIKVILRDPNDILKISSILEVVMIFASLVLRFLTPLYLRRKADSAGFGCKPMRLTFLIF